MLTPPFIQHLPPSYNLELESKHYQNIKERLQTKARERYQSYSKEKKNKKKAEYGHERYKNLSEHEKQKLVEYRKKCYEMKKYIWLLINLAAAWDGCYYLNNYNC